MLFTVTNPQSPRESSTWYQSTADTTRQRMFAHGVVPIFGLVMVAALWFSLPAKDLEERLSNAEKSDLLTVAYLRTWLSAKPDDWPLYLTLARHSVLLGEPEQALKTIAQLQLGLSSGAVNSGLSELQLKAIQLKVTILGQQANAEPSNSPKRNALLKLVSMELKALANYPLSATDLADLSDMALAIGDSESARLFLVRLLKENSYQKPAAWFSAQAKTAQGLGDMKIAIDLALRSFDIANTDSRFADAEKKQYFYTVAKMIEANNELKSRIELLDSRTSSLRGDRRLYEFMIRISLAAGRPDLAEKHARSLLQFSWLQKLQNLEELQLRRPDSLAGDFLSNDSVKIIRVNAAPLEAAELGPKPRLAFDDAAYVLAYDVFLANKNQSDAFKVAESAVLQAPQNLAWRKRLAQIAEWTQRPQTALKNWRYLADSTLSDKEAWQNVQRLSVMLRDTEATLSYLKWAVVNNNTDSSIDFQIADIFEVQGNPEEAVQWLRKRLEQLHLPTNPKSIQNALGNRSSNTQSRQLTERLIERLIVLAQRMENSEQEIEWLSYANNAFSPSLTRFERMAWLSLTKSNAQQAWIYLEAGAKAASSATDQSNKPAVARFWQLYTSVAATQGNIDNLLLAYAEMLRSGVLDNSKWPDLIDLVAQKSQADSLVLIEYLHAKNPENFAFLERLVGAYIQVGNFEKTETLLNQLTATEKKKFELNIEFLRLRASYYQKVRKTDQARLDLQKILELAPGDVAAKASIMWILIESKKTKILRQALITWEPIARSEQLLWGAWGAAFMSLGEPQKAVKYFNKLAKSRTDYLWDLAYADALAQTGYQDLAWSLRRRAWIEASTSPLRGSGNGEQDAETRQRVVALALQFAPGDRAKMLIAQLLRDTPINPAHMQAQQTINASAPLPKDDLAVAALVKKLTLVQQETKNVNPRSIANDTLAAGARELALSYLLSSEQTDTARAWLLSRYANDLVRPTWARLALALDNKNLPQLSQLLDDVPDWLPKMEQIEALKQTSQFAAAQTLAFETLDTRPYSDDAHQQTKDLLLAAANYVKVEHLSGSQSGLDYKTTKVDGLYKLTNRISLTAFVNNSKLNATDPASFNTSALSDINDQTVGLGASIQSNNGTFKIQANNRQAVRQFNGLSAAWQGSVGNLRFNSALGLNQLATELPALRAAAMKSFVDLSGIYNFSGREYLSSSLSISQFNDQDGIKLGGGLKASLELGHKLRLDYPDMTLKATLNHASYYTATSAMNSSIVPQFGPVGSTDPLAAFIPKGFNEIGLSASIGSTASQAYSRALRPFADLGIRFNSVTGAGYNLRAGFTTSVFGADRFSLYLSSVSKTPSASKGQSEIGFTYQWHF